MVNKQSNENLYFVFYVLSSYKIGENWKINEISGYEYLLDYELDIIYSRYQNNVRENRELSFFPFSV